MKQIETIIPIPNARRCFGATRPTRMMRKLPFLILALALWLCAGRDNALAANITFTGFIGAPGNSGIDYNPVTTKLIISAGNANVGIGDLSSPVDLLTLSNNDSTNQFSAATTLVRETKIAISRTNADGFTNGDVFIGDANFSSGGSSFGKIVRIRTASGGSTTVSDPWVTFSANADNVMAFRVDANKVFADGKVSLLSVTIGGEVHRTTIDGSGNPHDSVLTNLPSGGNYECILTLPKTTNYHSWAGHVLVGAEFPGKIYVIDPTNLTSVIFTNIALPEYMDVISSNTNDNFFITDRAAGTVSMALHSGFAGLEGDILVSDENSDIYHLYWNTNSQQFTNGLIFSSLASGVNFEEGTFAPFTITNTSCSSPSFVLADGASQVLDSTGFHFTIYGGVGSWVELFDSSDLVNWQNLGPVFIPSGGFASVSDSSVSGANYRFYKATSGSCCSTNAVGFVNIAVPGKTASTNGYALIANQLNNEYGMRQGFGNILGAIIPEAPDGTTAWKWSVANQSWGTGSVFSSGTGLWSSTITVNPGEGAFIQNGASTNWTLTLIGDVPTGSQNLTILSGSSAFEAVASSVLPKSAGVDVLGFPVVNGDQFFRWNPSTQQYDGTAFARGAWLPSVLTPNVGESFIVESGASTNRTWTQSFSICP